MVMKETFTCPVCDKMFFPTRSDAIYCSARCRQTAKRGKFNRGRNESQALYLQALAIVRKLQSLGAVRSLRTLTIAIIQDLPDSERDKLYEALRDDIQRIKRDKFVTGN